MPSVPSVIKKTFLWVKALHPKAKRQKTPGRDKIKAGSLPKSWLIQEKADQAVRAPKASFDGSETNPSGALARVFRPGELDEWQGTHHNGRIPRAKTAQLRLGLDGVFFRFADGSSRQPNYIDTKASHYATQRRRDPTLFPAYLVT